MEFKVFFAVLQTPKISLNLLQNLSAPFFEASAEIIKNALSN